MQKQNLILLIEWYLFLGRQSLKYRAFLLFLYSCWKHLQIINIWHSSSGVGSTYLTTGSQRECLLASAHAYAQITYDDIVVGQIFQPSFSLFWQNMKRHLLPKIHIHSHPALNPLCLFFSHFIERTFDHVRFEGVYLVESSKPSRYSTVQV